MPLFGSDWHHRGYALEVAGMIRKLKCDVVHVMNYSQFVPVIRKFNPRSRLALHMQCEWLTQLDPSLVRGTCRPNRPGHRLQRTYHSKDCGGEFLKCFLQDFEISRRTEAGSRKSKVANQKSAEVLGPVARSAEL